MNVYDVIIVGSGVAGLYCALHLEPTLNVLMITKTEIRESNSYLAQGGISSVLDEADIELFVNDTLKAGRYENNCDAVSMLAHNATDIISELSVFGMPFNTREGELCYTKEGGHSRNRIAYADDETGKHLIETLIQELETRGNITVWEHSTMVDLLEDNVTNSCIGIVVEKDGSSFPLYASKTVLACGGVGGLFRSTTNQKTVSGDALAIAYKHDIPMKDLSYIQFHPTTLFKELGGDRSFLISESVRGEGAYLLNAEKERFVDELLPRDVVTEAIRTEQRKNDSRHVYLDISHKDESYLKHRFPYIYEQCLLSGYNLATDPVPVTPSQHYHMGGIQVDLNGKTSMNCLYAIGEVSCSGVHGANRLASNSLLEALVYAKNVSQDINNGMKTDVTITQNCLVYPELSDTKYRSELVKSILIRENGGLSDELCYC